MVQGNICSYMKHLYAIVRIYVNIRKLEKATVIISMII